MPRRASEDTSRLLVYGYFYGALMDRRSRSCGFKSSSMGAFCGGGQQTHDSRVAAPVTLASPSLDVYGFVAV